jgi:nucleoid DNA-binding protein
MVGARMQVTVPFVREPIMLTRRYLPMLLVAGMAVYLVMRPAGAQTPTVANGSKPPVNSRNETFVQRVARYSDIKENDAERCIQSIGKALFEDLKQGKTDAIPGLGSFRIVRVGQSKDLFNGRPGNVPAYNVIEFSPEDAIADAANDDGVEAARFVPAFQYYILPGQTPGQKMGSSRMPNSRMR